MVRDAIPAELLVPTPAPVVPLIVTAATPGTLLIQFSDRLNSCNLDKAAIQQWQQKLSGAAK